MNKSHYHCWNCGSKSALPYICQTCKKDKQAVIRVAKLVYKFKNSK